MLATVGKTNVKVVRLPKVGVISTGSELVEPIFKPTTGQIRNSNGPMLIAQLQRLGIEANYLGIAKEAPEACICLPLITDHSCKSSKREHYQLFLFKQGGVQPIDFHVSAHMC